MTVPPNDAVSAPALPAIATPDNNVREWAPARMDAAASILRQQLQCSACGLLGLYYHGKGTRDSHARMKCKDWQCGKLTPTNHLAFHDVYKSNSELLSRFKSLPVSKVRGKRVAEDGSREHLHSPAQDSVEEGVALLRKEINELKEELKAVAATVRIVQLQLATIMTTNPEPSPQTTLGLQNAQRAPESSAAQHQ